MNIIKENTDILNAIVKVDIITEDYKDKVTKVLQDYRKKADIPGFRKGHIPMGMVKKQYGKSVMIDEVNKLLQESLSKFLTEEKIDILGNPLPKIKDNFSWDADIFSFEFEIGLSPEFEVDLKSKNKVTKYTIVATHELIDKEIENLQSRYGKMSSKDIVTNSSNITGTFVNEEKEINKKSTISIKDIKGTVNENKFIGSKVGDVLKLKTKNLFKDEHKLMVALGLTHNDAHELEIYVTFTIEEFTEIELAELNQELFNKLFIDGSVKTVTQLREKIKEDAEKQFEQQADQQLLKAITEHLVQKTKFDLPVKFLQKWMQTAGEKELTLEEATEEYKKFEKGLRYQLIEGKIMKDNDIKTDYTELVDYAKGFIKTQMAQFGNANPEEKELDDIASRILSNQEEAKRLQEQLISQKLITFYKENINFQTKEVTHEDFIKEVYENVN